MNNVSMEKEQINVAELLKDCPKGMELDSPLFDDFIFDYIEEDRMDSYPIHCLIKSDNDPGFFVFTKNGHTCNHPQSKCVIFPKGKTTWEGFVPPCQFKDGDVVVSKDDDIHLLRTEDSSYLSLRTSGRFDDSLTTSVTVARLATEEEKAKLFQAIENNGYKWNAETKTLEMLVKPKFKVGNRIKHKTYVERINEVTGLEKTYYILNYGLALPFTAQDEYELVPNKFDITTLKPFDKVFVRDTDTEEWCISFFSHCNEIDDYTYHCINGCRYGQCIPYEHNEHLLGTADACEEFHKVWKQ